MDYLTKQNIADIYPLSPMQQGMLFHTLYDPEASAYFEQFCCTITGTWNLENFQKAWNHLVDQHDIFRTVFNWKNVAQPLQIVLKKRPVDFFVHDLMAMNDDEQKRRIDDFVIRDRSESFDLARGPLMRFNVFQLTADRFYFVWSYHHILLDGWCLSLIISDLMSAYMALEKGAALPHFSRPSYKGYIAWLMKQDKKKSMSFWTEYLQGFEAPTALPWDNREAGKEFDIREYALTLSPEMTVELNDFARKNRVTMSTLIQGAWALVLGRYSGSDDVVFGSIVSGRPADLKGAEQMIGLFINALPVRVRLNRSVGDMLAMLQEKTLGIQEFSHSFLPDVKACSRVPRSSNLFDSLFIFENYPLDSFSFVNEDGIGVTDVKAIEMTNFDLTLCVLPGERLKMTLAYMQGRFRDITIERIMDHLVTCLRAFLDDASVSAGDIDILSPEEKKLILSDFNNTSLSYDESKTLVELFEEQVLLSGSETAVRFGDQSLTYEELNAHANRLAWMLREQGVVPGTLVGMMFDSPVETVVSIMGILKAGGGYLPIDYEFPESRIQYILGDSAMPVLLTTKKLAGNVEHAVKRICLELSDDSFLSQPSHDPERINNAGDTAYAIYTSGSTGNPKGSLIPHRGVVNLVQGLKKEIYAHYEGRLKVAQLASFSFDASVQQIFAALLQGHTLLPVPAAMKRDLGELIPYIIDNKIDIIDGTPSLWGLLIENGLGDREGLNLRHIIVGGEALPAVLVRRFGESRYGASVRWTNVYGVTEASVDSTHYTVRGDEAKNRSHVPIGTPLANTQIYILDRSRRPVPVGVQGEIYIGGHGLAKGYLNNPGLTEKVFVASPFIPGERLYKSGDLGRWLPEGAVEFIGRMDYQVKIRGFRIELGEIEVALGSHESVNDCVVVDRDDPRGEKFIIAYYASEGEIPIAELRSFLGQTLPEYMIPVKFIWLKELPLNTSGKIDRRSLPEPDDLRPEMAVEFVEPRNEMEAKIAGLWKQVLGVDRIGVKDNFFELGGHSLRATQVVAAIKKEMNRDVALKAIFECPTVEGLCRVLESRSGETYEPIDALPVQEYYEMSNSQKRLWFLYKLMPGSSSYNIHGDIMLEGKVDIDAVIESLRIIMERHEILRTMFKEVDDEPRQFVSREMQLTVPVEDVSGMKDADARMAAIIKEEENFVFNLETGPLFRVRIVKQAKEKHMLLLTMHHIISDAWSSGVLMKEAALLYTQITASGSPQLPPLRVQYRDFAVWQQRMLESGMLKEHEEYWKKELSHPLPVLDIPADRSRPAVQTDRGDVCRFSLDAGVSGALKKLTGEKGATLYMTILGIFALFLGKLTQQDDIIIGSPISGRNHPDLQDLIGFFVNTIALRLDLAENLSFVDFMNQVKTKSVDAFAHQDYPFDRLIDVVNPVRDTSRTPIFNTMFVLQNDADAMRQATMGGITFSDATGDRGIAKFDLTLFAFEKKDVLEMAFEYNTDLFDRETVEAYAGYFANLIEQVCLSPEKNLSAYGLLSDSDREKLFETFNRTEKEYPAERCIQELMGDMVEKYPGRTALVCGGETLTYGEMGSRVNRLAHYLQHRGVGPGVPVGIFMDRSMEMVLGVLAVIQAGGAYIPIESEYPAARISYILSDCGASLILTLSDVMDRLPAFDGEIIVLDKDHDTLDKYPDIKPETTVTGDDLVYVIYTSGSTGEPKGIEIEHRGLVNYITWAADYYGAVNGGSFPLYTSMTFDLTVTSIFVPLVTGHAIHIMPPGLDPASLVRAVITSDTDIAKLTPAHLEIADALTAGGVVKPGRLNRFILGGEALSPRVSRSMLERYPELTIYNEYGPAETVVGCIVYAFKTLAENCASVPIGTPIANTVIYILDRHMNPVPVGVPGEIYISSPGVARGYHNKDDITASSFVPNPFKPGDRLYKTGDQARWMHDGIIEYIGRVDHQVKIRGYRIEPGEIATLLLTMPGITECTVIDRRDKTGDLYLAAYYVAGAEIPVREIKSFLKDRLPDYMVPSRFMRLESMPLNPNGKVDRKALPEPDAVASATQYVAPRDEMERSLVQLWQELLGIEKIGIRDNFFDLGGHSLKVTQVIARVKRMFNRDVAISSFFTNPTVEGLAVLLGGTVEGGIPSIIPVGKSDFYELSHAQKRMWFLDQMMPGTATYNIPMLFNLENSIDIEKLRGALQAVVDSQESLRTCFRDFDGRPVQMIADYLKAEITVMEKTDNAMEAAFREMLRPFNLAEAPLFRVMLVKKNDGSFLMVMTMHHIISDGWSVELLMRQLMAAYASLTAGSSPQIPALPVQYRDYAAWQNTLLETEFLRKQEDYWKQKLGGTLPVIDLPFDRPRPAMQTLNGAAYRFTIPGQAVEKLRVLARQENMTMFMIMLAVFDMLIMKLSGQEDIIVGTPIAGRNNPDVQNIIGFFVNTLALRVGGEGNPSFMEYLERVRECCLGGYANQEYPFDRLIDAVNPVRDISRNPIFDIFFVYHQSGGDISRAASSGLISFDGLVEGITTSKFDITLNISDPGDELQAVFEYNTDLFNRETMARFAAYVINLVDAVTADPRQLLSDYSVMGRDELQKVIFGFNETAAPFPAETCPYRLFEEQTAKTPDRIAAEFNGAFLTYRELNQRANMLAHRLIKAGVTAESKVGLLVDRSFDILIGILGIHKAGGAYVPMDPDYPQSRIEYMLEDSQSPVLVTQSRHIPRLKKKPEDIIALDREDFSGESRENPESRAISENLSHLIYTSGSTGLPKGVMIEHRNVTAFLYWCLREFSPGEYAEMIAATSMCFDLSVFEYLLPLITGSKVIILRSSLEMNEYLEKNTATMINTVPSALKHFISVSSKRHRVMAINLAGEPLKLDLVQSAYEHIDVDKVRNLYGPTEDTTYSTGFMIPRNFGRQPLIGRPIDNTRAYILDRYLKPVPVGVKGEIYLCGADLARGYWNAQEKTKERFIPNPFTGDEYPFIYKTGDLGSWLPDGNIDFHGRVDYQVKIRGNRIELGEIEARLSEVEEISDICVIDRDDRDGNKYLVAYYVAEEDMVIGILREFLKKTLPDYMIPSRFIRVDTLPLTPNGKVDRKALPDPDELRPVLQSEYIAPRSETEKTLADIWQQVLGVEQIGVKDNFFDLGGHSLKVTEVVALGKKRFSLDLEVRMLFEAPTIETMAGMIEELKKSGSVYTLISRQEKKDFYELSHSQMRLWFLDRMSPGEATYHIPMAMIMEMNLDVALLEQAIQMVVDGQESLRTGITSQNGEPVQYIINEVKVSLDVQTISSKDILQHVVREVSTPFDLSRAPLFRVRLFRIEDGRYLFVFVMHHIISDGWSLKVLVRSLVEAYAGLSNYESFIMPAPAIQYRDYAVWQNELIRSGGMKKQEEYWKVKLGGTLPVLDLPFDRPRPAVQTQNGAGFKFTLDAALTGRVYERVREKNITLYMYLLAVFNIMLSRLTNIDDIIVGSPIAGRNHPDVENVIGFFVNTLAFRTDLGGNPSFETLLERVREVCLEGYAGQDYPFDRLIDLVNPVRDTSRSPIFNVFFVLQNEADELSAGGMKGFNFEEVSGEHRTAKFDLSLYVSEFSDRLEAYFEYNTDLFDKATVERFAGYFNMLLGAVTADTSVKIGHCPMLGDTEKQALLADFNATDRKYGKDIRTYQLFEEQARKNPGSVAVVYGDTSITYGELNVRANQLAGQLREKGVRADDIVGIMVDRSIEMIIGILAINKAGGAYLPLDPVYPQDRIIYMLEDAEARILLSRASLGEKIREMNFQGTVIDIFDDDLYTGDGSDLAPINGPENLIYVIYTSGSTGKPKGVMLEHGNVVNFITGMCEDIDFSPAKTIVCLTTISFDIFVLETHLALARGMKIVMASEVEQNDPEHLKNLIIRNGVNMLQSTPSRLRLLMESAGFIESLSGLSEILVGGEPFPEDLLAILRKSMKGRIINVYGPTETTVWSTLKDLTDEARITIGKPIANTQVYIVDRFDNIQPRGVMGELCIGGDGLARGYHNRPELTAEKFCSNPFAEGKKMYRTGDLALWLSDGNLICHGRVDHQVKIRGNRIELGEIETRIRNYEDIDDVAVIDRDDRLGNKYLAAYYVSHNEILPAEFREFLKKDLPAYMIPSRFMRMDSLPLTPNGKVDRKALPEPDDIRLTAENEYVAPEGDVETALALAWSEVLGLERVGATDNFFDLGGHSLLIMKVIARLQFRYPVTVQDFFDYQTVRLLAERIGENVRQAGKVPVNEKLVSEEKTAISVDIPLSGTVERPRTVFLTGVTGYLGAHLLFELLKETDAVIYCLVRAKTREQAEERILATMNFYFEHVNIDFARIHAVPGDIAVDGLAIGKKDMAELRKGLDAVMHCAADVRHFGDYAQFENINVMGTGRIIELARAVNCRRFHYISTMSVSGDHVPGMSQAVFREEDYDRNQRLDNVYARSKFHAEGLVRAAMDSGFNATIYRVGILVGETGSGRFQRSIGTNAFYGFLKGILDLGAIPDFTAETVEMTPVDSCREAIVKLMTMPETAGQCLHLYNPRYISLNRIGQYLNSFGYDITMASPGDFARVIGRANEENAASLEGMVPHLSGGVAAKTNILYDNSITSYFLTAAGFNWPELNEEFIHAIFRYGVTAEFFEPPVSRKEFAYSE